MMSFYAGVLTGLFLVKPVCECAAGKLYDFTGIRVPGFCKRDQEVPPSDAVS